MRTSITVVVLCILTGSIGCGSKKTEGNSNDGGQPAASEWHKGSEPFKVGDVELTVKSAGIGSCYVLGDNAVGEGFLVVLNVKNAHENKQLRLATWGNDKTVKLTDNFGNIFKYKIPPPYGRRKWVFEDKDRLSVNLNAGENYDDVMMFEEPGKNIEFLRLELPAKSIGKEGTIKIQINKSEFNPKNILAR
jgi:hypothetical protein